MPFKFSDMQLRDMAISSLEKYRTTLTEQMTRLRELGSEQLANQVQKEIEQVNGILVPKVQFYRRKIKPSR